MGRSRAAICAAGGPVEHEEAEPIAQPVADGSYAAAAEFWREETEQPKPSDLPTLCSCAAAGGAARRLPAILPRNALPEITGSPHPPGPAAIAESSGRGPWRS
jgi:hypothetical protein